MNPQTAAVLKNSQRRLDSLSQELITQLIALDQGSYILAKNRNRGDVDRLDIEFFEDGYRMVVYPMSADDEQLGSGSLLQGYPDGVLNGYDYDLDYELYTDNDDEEIDSFYKKPKELFTSWFIACWEATNIHVLRKPIFLIDHNGGEGVYNLQNSRWE